MSYLVPELWFEKLNHRVGLPNWAGAACFGLAPFLALLTLPALGSFVTSSEVIFQGVIDLNLALFTFYTASYLRRKLIGLIKYAGEMNNEPTETSTQLDLSRFSSTSRMILVYLVVNALVIPVFTLGQTGGPILASIEVQVPFLWFNFILATFFWTFGYSMYSIYKMGKLPLKLRPYTEDRTLGLRPFGKTSLNFTLIYVGVVSAILIPVIFGSALPLGLALGFLVLYPIGFLLFLLPLLSLHSKLVETKKKELAWIGPRATVVLQRVKALEGNQIDQLTTNEVSVLDKIRRDAQQIHTWPFDTGILARLVSILLSAAAILLTVIIRNWLHI